MEDETARYLSELNARFYASCAPSFDATRRSAWAGWDRVAAILRDDAPSGPSPGRPLGVLDIACGNMRLAGYLEGALPGRALAYRGVDSCDELVPYARRGSFRHVDIVASLLDPTAPASASASEPARNIPAGFPAGFDLVCCFGFFHHVPGLENREELMRRLVAAARPGGAVAASFWCFGEDPRLARKARGVTARALRELPAAIARDLEPGDSFLGWQGSEERLRYCHGFDDAEVDALAASVSGLAEPVARYRADGRSGRLNAYLVLRVL